MKKTKIYKKRAFVVCYICKAHDKTLYSIKEDGMKTEDYVCEDHKNSGLPLIGNSSRIYFHREEK